jgi:hypothetical protein
MRAIMAVMGLVLPYGPSVSLADSQYPLQATNNFTVSGTLTAVDPERQRLTLKAGDGHVYAVDAYDTKIVIPQRTEKAEVGDLVPGMQVRLKGYLLSRDIIAADQLRVLPLAGSSSVTVNRPASDPDSVTSRREEVPAPPVTRRPQVAAAPTPRYYHPEPIRLRGTVDKVDDIHGILTVRVGNHNRLVYVNSTTDLTDIQDVDDAHIGINPGDRITVRGLLREDGSVRATAISRSKNIDQVVTKIEREADNDNQIIGQISKESDKYSNRNIKVLIRPGREVEVEVGHGVPIMRDGQRISVHDLTRDDVVRVEGCYDGDDFKAERIVVVDTNPQD